MRRLLMRHLLVISAYLGLTLLTTYPLIVQFTSAIPGDGFDGWQNYWNLWWIKKALLEEHTSPFFTDYLYYPTGVSLLFHTLNPFNGLLTLPVQLLFGLTAAYNTVVLFSFVVSAYGAYLLVVHILSHNARRPGAQGINLHLAAFGAGVIYAFSPFHFAHLLGHMQVFSMEWVPFFVLYGLRVAEGKGRNSTMSVACGLSLVLASLCDWYQTLYLGVFTALLFTWLWWKRALTMGALLRMGKALALFAFILSPLLVPMVLETLRYSYMVMPREHLELLSADLLAFFTPSEFHPLWGNLAKRLAAHFTASSSERTVFLGFVPLSLVVLAVWKGRQDTSTRLWLLSFVVFFILALGPVLHIGGQSSFTSWGLRFPLPYALLQNIFPFRMARSVSRFTMMVMLSTGVLAAKALTLIRRWWVKGLLLLLILIEYFPAPYPMSPPDTPLFYRRLAQEPGDFAILNLPMNWDRPGYLLYQTVHGKRLATGYISRDDPRTLVERIPVLQHFRHLGDDVIAVNLARVAPGVFDYLNIRYVVVDFYKMPGGPERERTLALLWQTFGDVRPYYRDERLLVYRVEPTTEAGPFIILGDGWGKREESGPQVARAVEARAHFVVRSPIPRTCRLELEVIASSGGELEIRSDDGPLARYKVRSDGKVVLLTSPFSVEEGEEEFTLSWQPYGSREQLRILRIGLVDIR